MTRETSPHAAQRRVEFVAASAVERSPWKNGRGVTEQIAIWPRGASFASGVFEARVSKAAVVENGAFSSFPGFERVLLVTSGAGLVVTHGASAPRARLRRLEPYRFDGAWPTEGELVDGPVRDFNVFTRRGELRAELEAVPLALRVSREPLDALHALVHVLSGTAAARVTGEETPFVLAAGDSLRIDDARVGDELELVGSAADTVALVVRLRRTPGPRERV